MSVGQGLESQMEHDLEGVCKSTNAAEMRKSEVEEALGASRERKCG